MTKTRKTSKGNKKKTSKKDDKIAKENIGKMAFLESIFNAITDGITVIDKDCNIIHINHSLAHFYGFKKPEGIIGKKCYDIFQSRKSKCKNCPATKVFEKGRPQHIFQSRTDSHGNETFWEIYFYPIYDEKGKVIRVVEYSRNITREKRLEEEVKGYERRLADLLSVTRDIIAEIDTDMKCTFVSENVKELLGYTSKEVLKTKDFLSFLTPESKTIAKRYFQDRMADKTIPKSYELEIVHKNGRIIPTEIDVSYRRKGDKILGIVATVRDITERKNAEEALRASEEKYSNLFHKSNDAIVIHDLQGKILDVNQRALDFFGYSKREVMGLKISNLHPKEELKRSKLAFKTISKDGYVNFEINFKKKNGEIFPAEVSSSLFEIGGKKVIQGMARDITERRKAEEALIESEEMYKALVETSPDAVTATDLKGNITFISKRSLELYGFKKPNELIGKSAYKFIAPEDQERALKNLQKTLKKGVVRNLEYNFIRKDGTPFIGELNAALIKDISGKPKAFIATTRDITERKHAEEDLRFRLALEELITTFSTHFIYLKTDEIDDGIYLALEKIGSFAGVDRSYVFLLSDDGKKMDNTHEWCAKGIKSQKDQLQGLDVNTFKWGINRLKKLFPLDVPRVKDLPPEAEADKKVLQSGGIKSMLSVPIVIGGSLFGFIGFDSVRKERTWSDEIISMFQIVAEIFANALERKRAEESLEFERAQLLSIFDSITEAVYVTDPKTNEILYVNNFLRELLGRDPVGNLCYKEFQGLDQVCDFCTNDIILKEKGKPYQWEYHNPILNNDYMIFDRIIKWPDGRDVRFELAIDITERKKSEEEIKELKEFNESIVQSMDEGILILDEEGYISFINPKIEKMLGHKRTKLVGEHWDKIIAPDYHRRMRDCYAENLRGEHDRFEVVLLKKNGTELPVMVSASPQIKEGAFSGILAVVTDISERKREEIAREELMRYKMRRGSTYLIEEKEFERGKDVVYELYKNHFNGVIITREHPDKIKREIDLKLPLYWMTNDPRDKMSVKPEFPLLEKIIDDNIDRNTFVLLDRFDYLVSQNNFKEALNFIQHLNETFYARKAILVISLDPDTLTAQELSLLEKETSILEKRHEERLSADLLDLLEFVNRHNRVGESPSYKQVGDEFRISRTTARKRIRELVDKGLLMERKSGRFKYLVLTEKGKDSL